MTPAVESFSTGSHNSAPTTTSDPRGSLTTAERTWSKSFLNFSNLSAIVPAPNSGPPSTITLVGSPPVCESITRILDICESDMLNHATGDWYKRKNQPRINADRHGSKTNKGRISLK